MARILLMEDDKDQAMMLAGLIQTIGHDVTITYDADEAFQMLEEIPVDLIITDVFVRTEGGSKGGILLAGRVRLHQSPAISNTPIIAISGSGVHGEFFDVRQQMRHIGAAAFLSKPTSRAALASTIDDVLAGRAQKPTR